MRLLPITAAIAFGLALTPAFAQWTAEEIASGVQKQEFTRHVLKGQKLLIKVGASLQVDCTPTEGAEVKITKDPEHGSLDISKGLDFPYYPKENPRSKCNEKKTPRFLITYKPENGYSGVDSFEYVSLAADGFAQEITINVNVRSGGKK